MINPGEAAPQILDLPGQPTAHHGSSPRRIELPYLCLNAAVENADAARWDCRSSPWHVLSHGCPHIGSVGSQRSAFHTPETPPWPHVLRTFSDGRKRRYVHCAPRGTFIKVILMRDSTQSSSGIFNWSIPSHSTDIRRLEVYYLNGEALDLCIVTGRPVRLRFVFVQPAGKARSRSVGETRLTFSSKDLYAINPSYRRARPSCREPDQRRCRGKSAFSLW